VQAISAQGRRTPIRLVTPGVFKSGAGGALALIGPGRPVEMPDLG
jgi:hypothetical protein